MIKCKSLTFLPLSSFIIVIKFYFSILFAKFITLCIDFLLYMSIIVSEEREISKELIQGMKEMKEMKENFIQKEMLQDSLDNAFWQVMDARTYFLNELIYSDYMNYAKDMAGDNNDLIKLLNESCNSYVHPYIARKISLHYKAVQNLMRDIKFYLRKNFDIDYNKEIAKRKAKK